MYVRGREDTVKNNMERKKRKGFPGVAGPLCPPETRKYSRSFPAFIINSESSLELFRITRNMLKCTVFRASLASPH